MAKHSSHIVELAKRGAEARLNDLVEEAKLLWRLFPHLHDSYDKDELPISFLIAQGSGRLTKRNVVRRRRMSAATRKAASARMTKYRAARRKANKA